MQDLTVRSITARDWPEWLALWDGYNRFYGRSESTALPADITRNTFARFLDAEAPVHALVAEERGHLIGIAHYLFHLSTTSIAPTCYLQDLFTSEPARGKGAGRALILAVHERAKAAGAARLYWQTHESNRPAMRLYDKVAQRSGFLVYRMPV
ncbi:MAG TPA: GNAT family N-acetyltransferase [Steroidobacteraceae bacterium]|jgi:GNAT superfamily N-acetyltransferase